jgi:hypothetical protein
MINVFFHYCIRHADELTVMFLVRYNTRHADVLTVMFPVQLSIIHADGLTKLSEIIVLEPVRSGKEKDFSHLKKNFRRSPFL